MKLKLLLLIPIILPVSLLISCQKQATPQRPNILFILADDLGYYDLSCLGSAFYETPNIDRIAGDGAVFTQGYAARQVCSPSGASMRTGQIPARHVTTDRLRAAAGA